MHVHICQAVVDKMNDATFKTTVAGATPYTAIREPVPVIDVGQDDDLHVTAHCGNRARVSGERVHPGRTFEVIVTVAKRIEKIDNATIDPLQQIGENIDRELTKEENLVMAGGILQRIEATAATPPFIPDMLRDDHTFFAQIPLTYLVHDG